MAIKLITAPASEPITTADAKAHLRVEHSDDDTYIEALIVAARQAAEHMTGRALMPQTLELALDSFPRVGYSWYDRIVNSSAVPIPKPPVATIASVKYIDQDGVQQTLDASKYMLDSHSEPARILPAYGTDWPTTREQVNAVLIQFTCGYENAAAVPQAIKNWMLLTVGKLYENRESVVAGITVTELPHADRLLDPYKIWSLA